MVSQHAGQLLVPATVPNPVDIRLLPALIVGILACWFIPRFETTHVFIVLLTALLFALALTLWMTKNFRRTSVLTNVVPVLVTAVWLGLIPATATLVSQVTAQESGWDKIVTEQTTTHMRVTVTKDSTRRETSFGEAWYQKAKITAHSDPLITVPYGASVLLRGNEDLENLSPGETFCFNGTPSHASNTVFVSIKSPLLDKNCDQPYEPKDTNHTGRELLREKFRQHSAETTGYGPQLLPGLTLGDRTQQSPELESAMQTAGLSHLSAVSGLHISLLAVFATKLLRTLRLGQNLVLLAITGLLLIFGYLVGWEPSVIRATIMGLIGAFAMTTGRGSQALPMTCLAGILMLSFEPAIVTEASFQLSLTATLGIVIGASPMEQWLKQRVVGFLPDALGSFLSSSIAIAFVAQLACQPIIIGITGNVNIYSVPANVMVTPFVPFVTIPAVLALILVTPVPVLGELILQVASFPATAIGAIAIWVDSWSAADTPWPETVTGWVVNTLHVIATWLLFVKLLRWQRQRPETIRPIRTLPPLGYVHVQAPNQLDRSATRHRLLVEWAVIAVASIGQIAVLLPAPPGKFDPGWSTVACEVAEGNMLLARTGEETAIAVIYGKPHRSQVAQCLQRSRVNTLDAIYTHNHEISDFFGENHPETLPTYSTDPQAIANLASAHVPVTPPLTHHYESDETTEHHRAVRTQRFRLRTHHDAQDLWAIKLSIVDGEHRYEVLSFTASNEQSAWNNEVSLHPDQLNQVTEDVDVLYLSNLITPTLATEIAAAHQPRLTVVPQPTESGWSAGQEDQTLYEEFSEYGPVIDVNQYGTTAISVSAFGLHTTTSR